MLLCWNHYLQIGHGLMQSKDLWMPDFLEGISDRSVEHQDRPDLDFFK